LSIYIVFVLLFCFTFSVSYSNILLHFDSVLVLVIVTKISLSI